MKYKAPKVAAIFTARIRSIAKVMFSAFLSFCSQGGGWRGVSRKVHSEHIVATKVLIPMGGGVWCPGKCTLSTSLLQKYSCPWGGGGGRGGVRESAL